MQEELEALRGSKETAQAAGYGAVEEPAHSLSSPSTTLDVSVEDDLEGATAPLTQTTLSVDATQYVGVDDHTTTSETTTDAADSPVSLAATAGAYDMTGEYNQPPEPTPDAVLQTIPDASSTVPIISEKGIDRACNDSPQCTLPSLAP